MTKADYIDYYSFLFTVIGIFAAVFGVWVTTFQYNQGKKTDLIVKHYEWFHGYYKKAEADLIVYKMLINAWRQTEHTYKKYGIDSQVKNKIQDYKSWAIQGQSNSVPIDQSVSDRILNFNNRLFEPEQWINIETLEGAINKEIKWLKGEPSQKIEIEKKKFEDELNKLLNEFNPCSKLETNEKFLSLSKTFWSGLIIGILAAFLMAAVVVGCPGCTPKCL
jgi:hypothetical protein